MQIKNNFRKFISRYSKIFYICYVLLFIEFISASGLVFLVATTKIISPDPQKRKAIFGRLGWLRKSPQNGGKRCKIGRGKNDKSIIIRARACY